jgi:N-acetylglucosaminyldiphosphoundecaprenol N-acetyl-beta-D-mannosaminyltransferase
MASRGHHRQILGINFYVGDVAGAIDLMSRGGLLVVPAAPALKDMPSNPAYREAVLNADVAITDSAFMVMLWNLLESDGIPRISGLEYLNQLLRLPEVRCPGNTLWIMAGPPSTGRNLAWLRSIGVEVPAEFVYEAPIYRGAIEDEILLRKIDTLRPAHVIVTLGGGTQERVGLYLKRQLDYLPAIHCIGAAIAFLSGDQVRIPMWADRFYLGWLMRCISAPRRFVPRYWSARKLAALMIRYRSRPPLPLIPLDTESTEAA